MTERTITIDPLSASSLRVEIRANGRPLSTATGFVVEAYGAHFLVTNWHVVAGRNPDTGELLSKTGAVPDEIAVVQHMQGRLGAWKVVAQPLRSDEGEPLWIEHPDGNSIDVVALHLNHGDPEVIHYPLDLGLADTDIVIRPAMSVSIIGYPFGLATGMAWPIWKTGHVASDPDIDYDARPAFLIDATTRGGMSGSPVVFRTSGGFHTRDGAYVMAAGIRTVFMGVYSGRIHEDAEIGRVWRPRLVREIIDHDRTEFTSAE